MSSSANARTSFIISGFLPQPIDLKGLFTHPKARTLVKGIANARSAYFYHQGSKNQAEICLETKPQTPEQFYQLSKRFLKGKATMMDQPIYDNQNLDRHFFAISILFDAARGGHQKAKALLGRICQDEELGQYYDTLVSVLKERGYTFYKHFWSRKEPLIAHLDTMVLQLQNLGSVGHDYFVEDPATVKTLEHFLIHQIAITQDKLRHEISAYCSKLDELAQSGKEVEFKRETQAVLKSAKDGKLPVGEIEILELLIAAMVPMTPPEGLEEKENISPTAEGAISTQADKREPVLTSSYKKRLSSSLYSEVAKVRIPPTTALEASAEENSFDENLDTSNIKVIVTHA